MQLKVNFTDEVTLTYDLVNEEVVDGWAEMLMNRSVNDLCPINHYVGYVSPEYLNSRILRLYDLADQINEYAVDRVIKTEITKDTYQHAINTMHVHFPELKNDVKYSHIWPQLTEYNDLIHWIESTVKTHWGDKPASESGLFRITLDFNKSNTAFRELPESSYKLFDPHSVFGELKLHYTHVGRHAQELYIGRDMVCPKEQFVPQRLYTASVRMHFTDNFLVNRSSWEAFYRARGIDFWGMAIDDPKMAFGYAKIGKLTKIAIEGKEIDVPTTITQRHSFRQKLVTTSVIGWEIV